MASLQGMSNRSAAVISGKMGGKGSWNFAGKNPVKIAGRGAGQAICIFSDSQMEKPEENVGWKDSIMAKLGKGALGHVANLAMGWGDRAAPLVTPIRCGGPFAH